MIEVWINNPKMICQHIIFDTNIEAEVDYYMTMLGYEQMEYTTNLWYSMEEFL
jgi:hypothetical protein